MAFNVESEYGTAELVKDGEYVKVQMVQVTYRGIEEHRVEVRKFVDRSADGGYVGPTKESLSFNSVEEIDNVIAALEAAKIDMERVTAIRVAQPAERKPRQVAARAQRTANTAKSGRKASAKA